MTALAALLLAIAPPQEARFEPQVHGGDPRSERPWVFSGELGWNGLAGIGLIIARHLDPHFTLEAGLGFAAEGAKAGFRARYGLQTGESTPFVGAGFLYGTGFPAGSPDAKGFQYSIRGSPFLQLVAGYEYQSRDGFTLDAAAGYARLLRPNLTIVAGTPTQDDLSAIRIATGSGLVLSLAIGRAF